jgi:hypothetical protein
MGERGGAPGSRRGPGLAYILRACPEPPSTANGRHQRQPVNLKLVPDLNTARSGPDAGHRTASRLLLWCVRPVRRLCLR